LTFFFATTIVGRGQYVWLAIAILPIAPVSRGRNAQERVGNCPFGGPYRIRRCVYEILYLYFFLWVCWNVVFVTPGDKYVQSLHIAHLGTTALLYYGFGL
jgi:hypothetical protein